MKTFLVLLAGLYLAGLPAFGAPVAFTVHEWGTFTTVHAPDGTVLPGLEREEERLPAFVRSHTGFAPADKGWSRPVSNVTVKMETPVLYFYSDRERAVQVDVTFNRGSISQWYPERSGGETLPTLPVPPSNNTPAGELLRAVPPVDFGQGFTGSIRWDVTVLAPDTAERINAPVEWETPQWPRARVAGANLVKGPPGFVESAGADFQATAPVVEGFLFYRGVGNFAPPLHIATDGDGTLTLRNDGDAEIPFVWIYDHRENAGARYEWSGRLAPGGARAVEPAKIHFGLNRTEVLLGPLQDAGLSAAEARAMLATWRESYFEREGLRVFWIVPRTFTDRTLPLAITPAPDRLERVLVGRSEVITPALAARLDRDFRADGGVRWRDHRYFLAYRALAERRGVAIPGAASPLPAPR